MSRSLEVEHVLPYPMEEVGGLLEKVLRELDAWQLGFVEREAGELRGTAKCGAFSTDEMFIRLEPLPGPATKVLVRLTGNSFLIREIARRHRIDELFGRLQTMSRT